MIMTVEEAPTQTYVLARVPKSVRAARSWCRQALVEWNLEHISDDALLVVSELTTNVVHLPDELTEDCRSFRLDLGLLDSGTLRVAVHDHCEAKPRADRPASDSASENGRGLEIVAMLATAWGIDPTPTGKVVWATLAIPA
jgi:hypothetical protein